MTEFILILCTISSKTEAKKIANELVQKKLAACVNIIEGLTSIYEWKGKLCDESECLMIIKSKESLFDSIKKEIVSLHPYEVPEIFSFNISDGLESYLNWICENTK
ncbi:MAG: divalent-cation tolerance protein CutA [Spirochaetota bacterium]